MLDAYVCVAAISITKGKYGSEPIFWSQSTIEVFLSESNSLINTILIAINVQTIDGSSDLVSNVLIADSGPAETGASAGLSSGVFEKGGNHD
ncbi:hypothetical protein [Haladaptatus halobius]|uniref:hypothetical protein n=1 Tax=Haladaptatus halobius TaxID=2884875 RepID=UPI001D0A56D0|nr:hypothetical protein [Haladaptatus halobius]